MAEIDTTNNTQGDTALPNTSGDNSTLLAELVKKQLAGGGIVSSANADIETSISNAIGGIKTATEKSNQALESSFNREISDTERKASESITAGRAAGSGGVLNLAALRSLTETTDKSLKDLEQRKQELILQNDANGASKIADLQFKAIEFRQKAQQDFFSNLMESIRTQATVDQNKFNQQKTLGDLLTSNPQAGILATDTYEQAMAKVAKNPNSPDVLYKKAQIDNIRSEINKRNQSSGTQVASTEAERQAQALSEFGKFMVPGAVMSDGTPVVDQNGYVTPKAWKAAISEAPSKNLSRKDFITQFGYLLSKFEAGSKKADETYKSYGLTPQEIKLITG